MSAPKTDSAAIRQLIRALKAADHVLTVVYDGEEDVPVANETEALTAITAVDEAYLHVVLPNTHGETGWIRFVLGNEPDEVACDYTVNLEPVVGPVTTGWWD